MSIARFIRRAAQPGNYTTQYGLPQSSVDYLNQPLPDISGIFSLPQATEITEEDITDTESPVGLTEEQLRLLYPQVGGGDGPRGGGDFGNLDLSTAKQFNINGNIVTGFKNLNTGLYQDISGLNIQNLGGNTIYGGILDALSEKMGFKRSEPTYPGLLDMVSPKALIRNPGMFRSFFARQDVAKQKAIQDAVDKANRAAAEANIVRKAEARNPDVYRSAREQGFTGPGGGFSTTGRYNESAFSSTKSSRGRQDF